MLFIRIVHESFLNLIAVNSEDLKTSPAPGQRRQLTWKHLTRA